MLSKVSRALVFLAILLCFGIVCYQKIWGIDLAELDAPAAPDHYREMTREPSCELRYKKDDILLPSEWLRDFSGPAPKK